MSRDGGFTLIEIILVLVIFSVIAALASVNLIRPQGRALLDTTVTTLVADLRQQQLKSMVGYSENGNSSIQGIFFEANSYTLFKDSYIPDALDNFTVDLGPAIVITNNLPGSRVVFSRTSGEVDGFAGGMEIEISNPATGETKTVGINRFGSMEVN